MEQTGAAVRAAAVAARDELLRRAAARWQAPPGELVARAGRVWRGAGEGAALDYWELLDPGEVEALPPAPREESAPAGRVAALVSDCDTFVHDLRLPGMVHGRVLRPPGYGRRLTRLDDRAAGAMRGVLAVVVDGSFAGVVAEREEQAIAAREVLAGGARWQAPADTALPDAGRAALAQAAAHTTQILDRGPAPAPAPEAVAATLSATYSRPFLLHAALGPSAAAARLDAAGRLTVWSHTQGPFQLRAALADALAREPAGIRVIHVDGAGCYGHNGADDAALDAALLALAVPGRPVLVKWTRTDENRWEPFGSAMIVTCAADLDAIGSVLHWRHEVRSYPHGARPRAAPGHSALLAAWHRRRALTPPPVRNSRDLTAGPQRNAEPPYRFPRVSVVTHFVPEAPVRVSALRSLGAYANVFAAESFMDELAARAGTDPVSYRLRHLRDHRARDVLAAAVAAAPAAGGGRYRGRGVGLARYKNLQSYVAVVCDAAVDPGSGRIRLEHAAIAADAGRIIDRDGLANQLEGGFLQAASWTLKEAVRWDRAGMTGTDWDSYPVLRFSEVPPVALRLLDRPELPSLGAGEAAHGPAAAAIANAAAAAAGVRLRHTPFTPARVMAALTAGPDARTPRPAPPR